MLFGGVVTSASLACDPQEPVGDAGGDAVADIVEVAVSPVAPGEVTATKVHVVGGRAFTFEKYIDHAGEIRGVILDEHGREVSEAAVPRSVRSKLGEDLRTAIDHGARDGRVDVLIALVDVPDTDTTPTETSEAVIDDRGTARVTVNGRELNDAELRRATDSLHAQIAAQRDARLQRNRAALRELGRHAALASQPGMVEALANGRGSVRLVLDAREVDSFLRRHDHLIAGMELADPPEDHLAAAMLDTKIDPHALGTPGRRGAGVGIYMSEETCAKPGHITNYQPINANPVNASTSHAENVSAILRGVSPESYVYCRSGYTLPTAADLNGYNGNPRVYIESHSWGESTGGGDYRIRDRDFDNHVYNDGIANFQSAGNITANNPNGFVSSPAKALNLNSLGNYDDSTHTINPGSCHIDSEVDNDKPEFSAPGTKITAGGWTYTGTSQAAPHAAAFAADLMSANTWLQLKPARVKAAMLSSSDSVLSGGPEKVGVGGIDFYRAYYNGTSNSCTGDNAAWSAFDAGDYLPNNGTVDYSVALNAAAPNVRIALSWLNRGTYTYEHRADAFPLGIDLDLCVFDPNGAQIACSTSHDNPYELVSFDPVVTGNYRIRITRFANRDTASKLHMAVHADW